MANNVIKYPVTPIGQTTDGVALKFFPDIISFIMMDHFEGFSNQNKIDVANSEQSFK